MRFLGFGFVGYTGWVPWIDVLWFRKLRATTEAIKGSLVEQFGPSLTQLQMAVRSPGLFSQNDWALGLGSQQKGH